MAKTQAQRDLVKFVKEREDRGDHTEDIIAAAYRTLKSKKDHKSEDPKYLQQYANALAEYEASYMLEGVDVPETNGAIHKRGEDETTRPDINAAATASLESGDISFEDYSKAIDSGEDFKKRYNALHNELKSLASKLITDKPKLSETPEGQQELLAELGGAIMDKVLDAQDEAESAFYERIVPQTSEVLMNVLGDPPHGLGVIKSDTTQSKEPSSAEEKFDAILHNKNLSEEERDRKVEELLQKHPELGTAADTSKKKKNKVDEDIENDINYLQQREDTIPPDRIDAFIRKFIDAVRATQDVEITSIAGKKSTQSIDDWFGHSKDDLISLLEAIITRSHNSHTKNFDFARLITPIVSNKTRGSAQEAVLNWSSDYLPTESKANNVLHNTLNDYVNNKRISAELDEERRGRLATFDSRKRSAEEREKAFKEKEAGKETEKRRKAVILEFQNMFHALHNNKDRTREDIQRVADFIKEHESDLMTIRTRDALSAIRRLSASQDQREDATRRAQEIINNINSRLESGESMTGAHRDTWLYAFRNFLASGVARYLDPTTATALNEAVEGIAEIPVSDDRVVNQHAFSPLAIDEINKYAAMTGATYEDVYSDAVSYIYDKKAPENANLYHLFQNSKYLNAQTPFPDSTPTKKETKKRLDYDSMIKEAMKETQRLAKPPTAVQIAKVQRYMNEFKAAGALADWRDLDASGIKTVRHLEQIMRQMLTDVERYNTDGR